jgi:DNA polymerase-2
VLRRRLRRKLKDYTRNVPPHVQAARKAEAVRAQRGLPPRYADGGWIEYLMTVSGPEPKQYRQSPIDYEFYIDKQIKPVADSILVFKSTSMEELLNRQIGLF